MSLGSSSSIAFPVARNRDINSVDKACLFQRLRFEYTLLSLDNTHKYLYATMSEARNKALSIVTERQIYELSTRQLMIKLPSRIHQGSVLICLRTWLDLVALWVYYQNLLLRLKAFFTNAVTILHVSQIKPYPEALVGTPVDMKEVAELPYRVRFALNELRDVRESSGTFDFLIPITSALVW